MALEFKMPDIGEGVAEGEIVRWLVSVGDTLAEDQPMVEIMTDKATVEITSGMNFLWSPEGISVEALDRHYQDVLVKFYRRPRMIWYYIKFTLRYPAHLARLSRFLFHYLMAKTRSILSGRGGLLLQQDQVHLDRVE